MTVTAFAVYGVAYVVGGSGAIEDKWVAMLVVTAFFGGFLASAIAFVLAVAVKARHERWPLLWLPLSVFPALLAFLVLGEAFWWEYVAELSASASDVSERIAAVSEQISGLLADPRLAQILSPQSLSQVRADLNASLTSLRLVTAEVNPSLVLWNTLGSAAELGSSAAGGPGTLTIPGAGFVAGRFGGGVFIPPDRGDQSEQLRFGDYSLTPDGTIELWFRQDGYNTVSGQPDDGRFHSFWSPDTYPTVRGAAVYTYQVPGEGWHFDIWDGTNGVRNTVTPDIAAGEWHHVAFTWSSSGSYTEVYLDGVLLNRVEQTLNIAAPLYLPMQFGFDWDANAS